MSLTFPNTSTEKLPKFDWLRYLGYRVSLGLDDGSTLSGRLVSLSPCGNVILTHAERERPFQQRKKRSRDESVRRECYSSVLFVRGDSVVTLQYNSSLTNDSSVVDHLGAFEESKLRTIQIANTAPGVPFSRH
ncbi:unnamed protein product [Phytomonas sp. EM1]|nr:unnamed protein product [Phytomonas sp. EM1]|eukprot:CCW61550.1 unnamed protein product [Phytomonas sp. isolate EM1]